MDRGVIWIAIDAAAPVVALPSLVYHALAPLEAGFSYRISILSANIFAFIPRGA